MRKWLILLTSVALLCLTAIPAMTSDNGPDGMTLDHYKAEANNLVVTFNHSTHTEQGCKECHHKWDESGDPQPCSTSGCHDVMDKKDKTEHSYYLVIHNMRPAEGMSTCVSCHKDTAGSDKEKKKQLAGCRGSACHP